MHYKFYDLHRTSTCKKVIYFKLTKNNYDQIIFLFHNSISSNNTSRIDNKIYLIYSPQGLKLDNIEMKSDIYYIDYELDCLFDIINLRNSFVIRNRKTKFINKKKIINLYDDIRIENSRFDKLINLNMIENYISLNNEIVDFKENNIQPTNNKVKNYCLFKNINIDKINRFDTNLVENWDTINHDEIINKFNLLKIYIVEFINNLDNNNIDYSNFLEYNVINEYINTNNFDKFYIEEHSLNNVYHNKRHFYDKNGDLLNIEFFDNDNEYREYKQKYKSDKSIKINDLNNLKRIDTNVFYLNYIYDFYNFGEFWDCMIRLLYTKDISNYTLFHLEKNRVYNINYYFDKLSLEFPNKNDNLIYKSNHTKDENENTIHFDNIHFTTLNGSCRGYFDNHISFKFNNVFNNSEITDKNYILYLKRGSYGRELINEDVLIKELSNFPDVIIIDGRENIEDMIHYWTNSILVIGAHGSLLKNMIYCKKNPLFIELSPLSRHTCFHHNGTCNNFLYFYITLPNDKNENVILENDKLYKLIEMIEELV